MLGFIKTIAIILLVVLIGYLIYSLPKTTEPPRKEPPCEELAWMRDAPQARCVEYWKNIKVEEA